MPPLVSEGGGLVCESVGTADLLSDHFGSKQSREAVDLPLTCHPFLSLTTLPSGRKRSGVSSLTWTFMVASDPLGMFPLFLKRTDDDMAPRLSVVFRLHVRLSSVPACWRQSNVTLITNGPPSFSVVNHRPISITSVLSKVFRRLVSVRLGRFMERSSVLPSTQFAYQKFLCTCDALLCVSHTP